MSTATFEEAYRSWNTLIERDAVPFASLDKAERIILDHEPRSASDAVKIVHVLRTNAEAGQRGDGRDVKALARLHRWLEPQALAPRV